MKRFILTLISVFCLTLAGCDRGPSYSDLDGNQIRLSQYKGQWLVINYWASWCKSCGEEIPELNAFYHAHKNQGVKLIGVNYDLTPVDKLKQLVAKFHIEFPVLTSDPAKEIGIDNVPGLPSTYIVGPDGKLVKRLFGVQTKKTLEDALAVKFAQNKHYNGKYLYT